MEADFDVVSPRCRPDYSIEYRGREPQRERLNAWSDEVAIANTQPNRGTAMYRGQEYPVVEIGPPPFAEDCEVWERQPEEDEKQWRMFRMYRDMEPWKRNKQQVQRQFGVAQSNGTGQAIGHMSAYFRWEERVQSFDAAEDRRMTEELYQRKLSARIAAANVGQNMRRKAAEALTVMVATAYRWVEDKSGKRVRVMRPALTPNEVVRLAEVGIKLERLGLGENGTEAGRGAYSFTQINQTINLSDQQLLDQAHEIIEARARSPVLVGTTGRTDMDGK